ncbi:hypothetical protein [Peptacetobacter sp.]|uniref:hypothetical protein n=1 Tax=Peptacetobacter sp. TaxID=2991975 RepID=UPI00262A273A|nr:hypothetical protein [Peptacetobacter sp.]MEE0451795.1 hypothetical protein [Peptacetobacter sp.]
MSKILALSNIELRKNLKFYYIYCATILVSIIAVNGYYIYMSATTYDLTEMYRNQIGGVFYGAMILEGNMVIHLLLSLGVIGAILYTSAIWLKDWNGSHKNIYTYMMIPGNNMKIYAAKMLNSLFFVYMVMICETIALFVSKSIFNMTFASKCNIIDTSFNADLSFASDTLFVCSNAIDFLIENILYVFLIITVISTLMIIITSMKNKTLGFIVLGIFVFIAAIFGVNIGSASSKIYQILLNMGITDNMVVANIMIAIIVSIICTAISYFLSNRKMSV